MFTLDAHEDWKGWERSQHRRGDAPGGTWRLAHPSSHKHAALRGLLDLLPAIVECPGCGSHNLLDPRTLRLPRMRKLAAAGAR